MKPGDRIIIHGSSSPSGAPVGATVLSLTADDGETLVLLDECIGHDACDYSAQQLIERSYGRGSDYDSELIKRYAYPNSNKRLYYVFGKPGKNWNWDDMSVSMDTPDDHVPGIHHCAKGCGQINDHAGRQSFVRGKYVCYSCRNIWV